MKHPSFVQTILYSLAVFIYALTFTISRDHHGWSQWAWGMSGWGIGFVLFIAALNLPASNDRSRR